MTSRLKVALVGIVAVGIGLAATIPLEAKGGYKRGKHHGSADVSRTEVSVHIAFSPREVQVIREYYAPRQRRLPPGLQKKLHRTGQLPPGWQKKLEPFPMVVERELVVLPSGYRRGVIDGHAVVFNPGTQVIIDVAAIF